VEVTGSNPVLPIGRFSEAGVSHEGAHGHRVSLGLEPVTAGDAKHVRRLNLRVAICNANGLNCPRCVEH
jgi:hypothetical protein